MIIVACLKPKLPELPSPITRMDLVYHIGAYTVIGLFWRGFRVKSLVWFFAFFAQGLIIEIIQPYFGRHFELIDLLFNSLGILLGMGLSQALLKRKRA